MDIEDPNALRDYMRSTGRIGADEPVTVRTLAGGVSNRTVLVTRASGEAWVLKQALPKLRVAVDWFADPARIGREASGIRWLSRLAPPDTIPQLVFEDVSNHLLAMRAVPEPHANWKSMLLAGDVRGGHVEQFASLLATVHRRAAESAEPLREIFGDRSFFQSLRLEPYYAYAATQVSQAAGFLEDLIADTLGRQRTIVHGDYSPKNVLVHNDRLVLLDHEVIHWGDPAFDVGFGLTHLLSKAHHLAAHRAAFADAAARFIDVYARGVGPAHWDERMQAIAGRHLLGCLLARVAGRSPLEYLGEAERARQRDVVARLMGARMSMGVSDVVRQFVSGIEANANDRETHGD